MSKARTSVSVAEFFRKYGVKLKVETSEQKDLWR
jgi:hypothetical protein